MSCTFHIDKKIDFICVAGHKCQNQRKLCAECVYHHGVDSKQAIPINIFHDLVIKKIEELRTAEHSEIPNKCIKKLKSTTSQIQSFVQFLEKLLKQIEPIVASIKQIEQIIDSIKDKSYDEIIKHNPNLEESTYTDLDKLVQLVQEKGKNDWISDNNYFQEKLEEINNYLAQEIVGGIEKWKEEINKKMSLYFQIESIEQVFQKKSDLYEALALSNNIDKDVTKLIIKIFQQKQISDGLQFFSIDENQKYWELFVEFDNQQYFHKQWKLKNIKKNFRLITNIINNIDDIGFKDVDSSSETNEKARRQLIDKISDQDNIIEFLKFLVHLTAMDNKLIQCGSNSLSLLVDMKVNLRSNNFENIRIKDTNLINANFMSCNFSGSEFENVDISGVNLNEAKLFKCQWKNIHINELYQLNCYTGGVKSVCFSPDGNTLASCGDQSILLWEIKTGKQKSKLQQSTWFNRKQSEIFTLVSFFPDCHTLASVSFKSIKLWDVDAGTLKFELNGHTMGVNSICFAPDGTLATGSDDKSIRLWDIKTRRQKSQLNGHTNEVTSVCFSPDGATLASGSIDNSIRLWDVKTGQQQSQLYGRTAEIISVAFSPNGSILASSGRKETILLWDVVTKTLIGILTDEYNLCQYLCFSPDGTTLASISQENYIILWDVKSGIQKSQLNGHTNRVNSVCFSPDGATIASGSQDNSIRLWDVKAGQKKFSSNGHTSIIDYVCFSPNGSILASSSSDYTIRLWDVKTGQQKFFYKYNSQNPNFICFSPYDAILAFCDSWVKIILLDIYTGNIKFELIGHTQYIQSICFSSDGTKLGSNSSDNTIRIWDVQTGKQILQLNSKNFIRKPLCFSPDSTTLASGDSDDYVIIWDVYTGLIKFKLSGHTSIIQQICFSSDGTILASGSLDLSIRLWDIKTQKYKFSLIHNDMIESICFSPDNTQLVSGSGNSIFLWDYRTGKLRSQLNGHTGKVYTVSFSHDGTILASGSRDLSIRLWDVKTSQQIQQSIQKDKQYLNKHQVDLQPNVLSIFEQYNNPITIHCLSQYPAIQAQRALIYEGEFKSQQNIDLKALFRIKGSFIFEFNQK